MNSMQNIVLLPVVITYLKKYSTVSHPEIEKKKIVFIPLILFFFALFYFCLFYYYYFSFTKPGFKLLGETK